MQSFVWDFFKTTGSIDAYLLYKEFETLLVNNNKLSQDEGKEKDEENSIEK